MKSRLTLVSPLDQLRGAGPTEWERLVRTAEIGSPDHAGVVHVCITLADRAVRVCVAPSAQPPLLEGLEFARKWIRQTSKVDPVKKARALCFSASSAVEDVTEAAVTRAQSHLPRDPPTGIDRHADHVVARFARLAAHHAAAAVCHTLDCVSDPPRALDVPSDAMGARAYQAACFGSARHQEFRLAAVQQAEWEGARSREANIPSLCVQVFHEYLGAQWRAAADVFTVQHNELILWALSGRVS